jgi:hypothetical protein
MRAARRAAAFLFLATILACTGEHQDAGEVIGSALPGSLVALRDARQTDARAGIQGAGDSAKQILFGDLHAHTTFSTDAFILSLPMMGGTGLHPPADACDFARFCSQLDFWSINDHAEGLTPRHWRETIAAIRQCNDVAGDPRNPDLVSFLGWEWTQVGLTPDDHYGHKNVVLLETDPERVPRRPITAPRREFRGVGLPLVARWLLPVLHFDSRQLYFDFQTQAEEVAAVPACAVGIDTRELPAECHEVADAPRDLYEKLEQWDTPSIVIPHGTSWGLMTPPGFDIARELERGQHDARRQRLFEVYSGHGSAELHRETRAAIPSGDEWVCPEPSDDFLPCCWRAGEIIRDRCDDPASMACEERIREARRNFVNAGVAGHLTVPGSTVADWLDCDQCRDCPLPAYSHRPGGSAQYALALTARGQDGSEERFRFGLIGSSDTHDARPGNGFKEFGRLENTEAPYLSGPVGRRTRDRREPAPRSESLVLAELPLQARRYSERGASFLLTGGLVAVHAAGRDRQAIWSALSQREVYGTSGERILLWFDLRNAPAGSNVPMGAEVTDMQEAPRLRVAAVGAFEQRPGCPEYASDALDRERLEALCLSECYHPGPRRRLITRLEVVRIRAQRRQGEPVAPLVEDPWGSRVRRRGPRGRLLCARHPGADIRSQRGQPAMHG